MPIAALVVRRALRRGDKGEAVRAVQAALRIAGHQLVIDCDFGGITFEAVRRFQAAHGLQSDGVVGPQTAAALDAVVAKPVKPLAERPLPSSLAVAPWLSLARALTGTEEIKGARSNPLILSWVKEISDKYPDLAPNLNWYVDDDTPWCGLFIAYCLAASGFKPAQAPLYALNNGAPWVREGYGVKLPGPALGAIVTMKRSGGGHVCFYEGEDRDYWFGRGGNQSDMVNVARYPKSRPIEGYFWPKPHPLPPIGPVRVSFSQAEEGTEA